MTDASLFRPGIGLETGARAEERTRGIPAANTGHTAGDDLTAAGRHDHFIRRDGEIFAGTHLIIEVVNGRGLDDEAHIERTLRDCVARCGATLLHIHTHRFSPQGVSGVAVLAESHISVHTWPEIGYGAFDVFMCGEADPWRAVEVLGAAFATGDVRVQELRRGAGLIAAPTAGARDGRHDGRCKGPGTERRGTA